MNATSIYLDNNASTQALPEVIATMAEVMGAHWGNPSSLHAFGERASQRVERARTQVMSLIGARFADEIVFTSGGTESINSAIHAALDGAPAEACILTGQTEHSALLEPLAKLERAKRQVQRIAVDTQGHLKIESLLSAIDAAQGKCALVSLQWANNETGACLSTAEITRIARHCQAQQTLFHLDAVQVPGKLPIQVRELGVDLFSISAHKFHGPQGVGALYLRRGIQATPTSLITGGPQEAGRRGGTHNVAGIAGMGQAAELAQQHVESAHGCGRVQELRDELESGLLAALPGSIVHAAAAGNPRLNNTCSLFIPGIDAELMLATLAAEGLAISSGAACSSSKRGPSEVLLAMGLDPEVASGSLRFSLSRLTTPEEIRLTLELVSGVAEELIELAGSQRRAP